MNKYLISMALFAGLSSAHPALGAILLGSVNGGTVLNAPGGSTFVELDPSVGTFSVGNNNFNLNNLYAFDELQNVTLSAALAANLGVTNIAIGTRINSHFVFFDPLANQTLQGSVTFDTPVLSAITLRPALIASNYLGAPNVTYLTPAAYGLEPGFDFVTLQFPDANSIRINFLSSDSPGDHFRVITQAPAVPEPAIWMQMLIGFGAVGTWVRRRKRSVVLAG